ncbi:hypothetical protein COCSUDRAFT_55740 [Coccomyxa subellipsoidea C-169]|uniref:Uncharacterized protein n=1 Tax=Coccomyxa subellipsoidea (strain C-169) TaxID=574566 RepID=I0ZAT8_COCSC|nr:hypothetical protein COCSUDRAFT_55740 [Coccomyxa subellipsoidea C-169]EIE27757.1 hypothetical protein COCSUDRAFT_55740 [Coccomyxa subellipsoidea C-169]|eukprot:XP_005652301.1 hypothetical protein COCSUDRAFT_55740 [Coccomyxa subellipsoidea C-169]
MAHCRKGGRSERRGRRYGEPGRSLQRVPGDSDCGFKRFAHELSCFREEHDAAYGADSSAVASSTASGRSARSAASMRSASSSGAWFGGGCNLCSASYEHA